MKVSRFVMFAVLYLSSLWFGGMDAEGYELSRGRQILLNQGLQLHSLVYTHNPALFSDMNLWDSANFTAFNFFYYRASSLLPSLPVGKEFGVAYHPSFSYTKFLDVNETPHANKLVSYQYGDELGVISNDPVLLSDMKATYAEWRNRYPNVLAYTNSSAGELNAAQLATYMQATLPDMISFDRYPGYSFTNPSPATARFLWYSTMQKYRMAGLAGNDGTGTTPIPYAQYLELYRNSYSSSLPSESFVRLQQNASWAFGYTFTNAFVYNQFGPESDHVIPTMFDTPGESMPNAVFNYVKESNRQSLNLGPALVRLVSTGIFMKPGTGNSVANTGLTQWSSNAGSTGPYTDYLTSITPTVSQGGATDTTFSDILIGYFDPLLSNNADLPFADGLHFMIVNGSVTGTAAASAQWYRLSFDFGSSGISALERLSRDTGLVERIELTHLSGSLYALDLNLPGGTGDLFRYAPDLLLGDFNDDGSVDAADYVVWRKGLDTKYTPEDFNVWRAHFGQTAASGSSLNSANTMPVPEPASSYCLTLAICLLATGRLRIRLPRQQSRP